MIGPDTGRADAEVIILASEALRTLGIQDYKIGVGQVQLLDLLLETTCLTEETRVLLKESIAAKDYVSVNSIIERASLTAEERDLLNSLSSIQTGEGFFARLAGKNFPDPTKELFERLRGVYDTLMSAGLKNNVFIDLGITRDFEYYTGIVFEVYSPALGFPICGGGRYNNLFARFGFPCPATGFALGIERILLVLEKVGKLPSPNRSDFSLRKGLCKSVKHCRGAACSGCSVEIDVEEKLSENWKSTPRPSGTPELPAEED